MGVVKDGMTWTEGIEPNATIVVGGWDEAATSLDDWPCFNGEPLDYFGSVGGLHLFLGETADDSWKAEGGANAVLIEGQMPDWVSPGAVDEPRLFCETAYSTSDPLPTEPDWLQGEETPNGYEFVAQIPSQVDGGDAINIGEGYGTLYVFRSADGQSARMLWQS